MTRFALIVTVLAASASAALACGTYGPRHLTPSMIQQFRDEGPAGLDRLMTLRDQLNEPEFTAALNTVAAQFDADRSNLYWYTDLDKARAAAKSASKPILSLRLLGKLTDEYSCANSRFFRTALYANKEISQYLRDNFVLHWESVRPVPVVTIDFGDGRVMKRTITGNSIHYILDSDGRVIDALPGLYGPGIFLRELKLIHGFTAGGKPAGDVAVYSLNLSGQLVRGAELLSNNMNLALRPTGPDGRPAKDATRLAVRDMLAKPPAGGASPLTKPPVVSAMRSATAKMVVEMPLAAKLDRFAYTVTTLQPDDENTLAVLAQRLVADCRMDAASTALVRAQNRAACDRDPALLARMVDGFETSMSLDTARNQFSIRRKIAARLAQPGAPRDPADLNDWVYAELFFTPRSDPWLGLAPDAAYTALTEQGCAR